MRKPFTAFVLLLVVAASMINGKQHYSHQPKKMLKLSSVRHDLMPSKKVAYVIEGALLYTFDDSPDNMAFKPKSSVCAIALNFANEFIYRTKLVESFQLPCDTTLLQSNSICYAVSYSKDGMQEITVGVNIRKRTVWISAITSKQH